MPDWPNVSENVCPWDKVPESLERSSAVTVWKTPSWFVHVTVVPTSTSIRPSKAMLWMSVARAAVEGDAAGACVAAGVAVAVGSGVGVGLAVGDGVAFGAGEAVGVGLAVGVAVAPGSRFVMVGVEMAVAVGLACPGDGVSDVETGGSDAVAAVGAADGGLWPACPSAREHDSKINETAAVNNMD